jgi:hypothetical protein
VWAEVEGRCQYEPIGWADGQTLVYRKWCDGDYTAEDWHPGRPGAPMLYDLRTGKTGASLIDKEPSYERCDPAQCVVAALAEKQEFRLGYLPGYYGDAIVSPDERWVAFTARHVFGPADLLVVSKQ